MGEGNSNDDMCMSAVNFIQSKSMQEDATLKNILQKNVGELLSFVEGKSMAQIRREARKREHLYSSIANAHLLSVEYEDVNAVTPATRLVKKDNIRWYRNRLTNDYCELNFKYDTTTVIVCNNVSKIDSLRKK